MFQPVAISCHKTDYLHFDLSPECNLVFFCHDVAADRDLHVRSLEALCEHLAAIHSVDRQVHLVYFSSTNICNANGRRIREDSEIYPHCLRDAAVVQAVKSFQRAYCYDEDGVAAVGAVRKKLLSAAAFEKK